MYYDLYFYMFPEAERFSARFNPLPYPGISLGTVPSMAVGVRRRTLRTPPWVSGRAPWLPGLV